MIKKEASSSSVSHHHFLQPTLYCLRLAAIKKSLLHFRGKTNGRRGEEDGG